jgi:hypothetical protein
MKLNGWLSLSTDPFKSGRAQLSALPRFRPGYSDRRQVSTKPVLEPLAAESLWPWGSAR